MEKLILLCVTILFLGACTQSGNTLPVDTEESEGSNETSNTNSPKENVESVEENKDSIAENESESTNEETETLSTIPAEIYLEIESKIIERLNSLQYLRDIMEVDYHYSEREYHVLLNLTKSFEKEIEMYAQGDALNSYYTWYSPEDLNAGMLKYHGYTIDFEKYSTLNKDESPTIYFDGELVYLISADFPDSLEVEQPFVISIQEMPELPIYYAEIQYKVFSISDYKQKTGTLWDFQYTNIPMSEWPKDMQEFVMVDPTIFYGLFIENESGLTLAYFSTAPLSDEERVDYINNLK